MNEIPPGSSPQVEGKATIQRIELSYSDGSVWAMGPPVARAKKAAKSKNRKDDGVRLMVSWHYDAARVNQSKFHQQQYHAQSPRANSRRAKVLNEDASWIQISDVFSSPAMRN